MPFGKLGDGLLFIGDLPLATIKENGLEVVESVPEYVTDIRIPMLKDAEFSCECDVNVPLFKQITGIEGAYEPTMEKLTYIGRCPYTVQRRRHRKRRINKKWAKRYGYIIKFRSLEISDITYEQNGDEIDILGRNVRVI